MNRLPHQTLFTEQLICYSTFSSIFWAWNTLFINSCLFKVYSFIKVQLDALVKLSQVFSEAFLVGQRVKNMPCNEEDLGLIPGLGRSPREVNDYSLQYSSGEFHGQRSLAGYSPWGFTESDMTERLTLSLTSHRIDMCISFPFFNSVTY